MFWGVVLSCMDFCLFLEKEIKVEWVGKGCLEELVGENIVKIDLNLNNKNKIK